jgi:putative ATP-binding cassette transporter
MERWDQILSGGEQQRMAVARVLIHRPAWVFMDEATSALDEAGQANIMRLLAEELPETAVVSIGHRPGLEAFHTRELVLEPGREGAELRSPASQRALRDIYRKMAEASRAESELPSFWSSFRQTLIGR